MAFDDIRSILYAKKQRWYRFMYEEGTGERRGEKMSECYCGVDELEDID